MNNVTNRYQQIYQPKQALVFFQHQTDQTQFYIESYDIDTTTGRPLNAHPLSEQEASHLAKALHTASEKQTRFLQPKGLLPLNVLYLKQGEDGSALWYTPAGKRPLFFAEQTGIPSGTAHVPALLWKATRHSIAVFALAKNTRPGEKAKLYCAPFFNTSASGNVCMGTVKRDFSSNASLEEFMLAWETYFFNSYFTHLTDANPVHGNIVQLWQQLIGTETPFNTLSLKASSVTLKSLLK